MLQHATTCYTLVNQLLTTDKILSLTKQRRFKHPAIAVNLRIFFKNFRGRGLRRCSLFITNTSEGMLKTAEIIELYRLRWQIELVFKTWKSLLNVHKVKAVKKERLECHLIAKFI